VARIQVQGRDKFYWPAAFDLLIKVKKKKNVRAHTQLAVSTRLAFTSPAKTVTSKLLLLSVLAVEICL
jgi:hypothetical protein